METSVGSVKDSDSNNTSTPWKLRFVKSPVVTVPVFKQTDGSFESFVSGLQEKVAYADNSSKKACEEKIKAESVSEQEIPCDSTDDEVTVFLHETDKGNTSDNMCSKICSQSSDTLPSAKLWKPLDASYDSFIVLDETIVLDESDEDSFKKFDENCANNLSGIFPLTETPKVMFSPKFDDTKLVNVTNISLIVLDEANEVNSTPTMSETNVLQDNQSVASVTTGQNAKENNTSKLEENINMQHSPTNSPEFKQPDSVPSALVNNKPADSNQLKSKVLKIEDTGKNEQVMPIYEECNKLEQVNSDYEEIGRVEHTKTYSGETEKLNSETGKIENVKSETGEIENVKPETREIENVKPGTGEIENVKLETGKIEHIKSETGQIEHINCETGKIYPVKSEALKIEQVKSEILKIERVKSETGKIERVKSETGKIERGKSETGKIERVKSETGKVECIKSETGKVERVKSETGKVEHVKSETGKIEHEKSETGEIEHEKSETHKIEHDKSEIEPDKCETGKHDPVKSETGKIEHMKSDNLETEKIEQVKPDTGDFVSSDPEENADNNNPEWELLKKLETDDERYKAVRLRWRNLVIPNPNKNLTYRNRGYWTPDKKQKPVLESKHKPVVTSRKRTHSADPIEHHVPLKRQRTFSCTEVFDRKMLDIHKKMSRERNAILQQHEQAVQNLVDKTNYQLRSYPPGSFNDERIRALHVQNVVELRYKCDDRLAAVESKSMNQLRTLEKAMEEVRVFNSFYQGLEEGCDDALLLTDEQLVEVLEEDHLYECFTEFYTG